MEREVLLTGIGGQGVQLAAKTLATAAVIDGRSAMTFGIYTGAMRGERTEATVVIGSDALTCPPTVSSAWCAIGLNHVYWPDTAAKLRSDGLAIIDADVFRGDPGRDAVLVNAKTIAKSADAPRAAAMVVLGALAASTEIVTRDALCEAAGSLLPVYRREHAAANIRAIEAGFADVSGLVRSAWTETPVREGSTQ
jgi:Pyruvate/2-oxoacid:ferredoxin oxidoreductase gamma subunit